MEHFYVKFGDLRYMGFKDIVRIGLNKHINAG